MRVLVADDDPACREVLASVLREEGHDVIVAQDGNEAWGILQNPRSPRLVFLDWTMPGMEGPEVCQRLRRREDGNYVYVIMLTASEGMERLREAFLPASCRPGGSRSCTRSLSPRERPSVNCDATTC